MNRVMFKNPDVTITRSIKESLNNLDNANIPYEYITKGYVVFSSHFFDSSVPYHVGLHYNKNQINYIELYRSELKYTSIDTIQESFSENQSSIINTYGEPTVFNLENDESKFSNWYSEEVVIVHSLYERFGFEEKITISILPTEEELKAKEKSLLRKVCFFSGIIFGVVFYFVFSALIEETSPFMFGISLIGGLFFGAIMYIVLRLQKNPIQSSKSMSRKLENHENTFEEEYKYIFYGMITRKIKNILVVSHINIYLFEKSLLITSVYKNNILEDEKYYSEILRIKNIGTQIYITFVNGECLEVKMENTEKALELKEVLNQLISKQIGS